MENPFPTMKSGRVEFLFHFVDCFGDNRCFSVLFFARSSRSSRPLENFSFFPSPALNGCPLVHDLSTEVVHKISTNFFRLSPQKIPFLLEIFPLFRYNNEDTSNERGNSTFPPPLLLLLLKSILK